MNQNGLWGLTDYLNFQHGLIDVPNYSDISYPTHRIAYVKFCTILKCSSVMLCII